MNTVCNSGWFGLALPISAHRHEIYRPIDVIFIPVSVPHSVYGRLPVRRHAHKREAQHLSPMKTEGPSAQTQPEKRESQSHFYYM